MDDRSLAVGSKPVSDESMTFRMYHDKVAEPILVQANDCACQGFPPFWSEAVSIHDGNLRACFTWVWQRVVGIRKSKVCPGGLTNLADDPGQALVQQGQQCAVPQRAGRVPAIH